MKQLLIVCFAAIALLLAAPSTATEPPGHAPPGNAHEEPAAGTHGDDAGHGEDAGHGDDAGHGEHHYYTADDDNDGIVNWNDPMNGEEPNELYVTKKLIFHAINLGFLIIIIMVFVRRPVADALRTRALTIRKELTDSARARDEAKQHHDEVAARLGAIEGEIQGMRDAAGDEAEVLEAKLIERAHAEAKRVAAGAERKIRDEAQRARTQLRRDAVELAVDLAEKTLRDKISAEDQQRLAREFLTAINDDGANANV